VNFVEIVECSSAARAVISLVERPPPDTQADILDGSLRVALFKSSALLVVQARNSDMIMLELSRNRRLRHGLMLSCDVRLISN
jgi:hypothetical protein